MKIQGRIALALLVSVCALSPSAAQQAELSPVAHPQLWPEAHSPAAITDPATEKMIDGIIARMTLEQKVGQLVQGDISTVKPSDLASYPLGSILAGGNSGPYGNERSSASDWHRLVEQFRTASLKPAANGIAIPIMFGVDAVHGHSNVPNATIFPHNVGIGATHDVDLVRRIGAATAEEMSGSGIEWTFAPTLAVPQDVRWGRSYEGYSSDPKIVAAYASAMVDGLQGQLKPGEPLSPNHVAATAKHYLADGGTDQGRDQGDAKIDEQTLIAVHAQGYPAAIDAGVLTVMASYSSWNGAKNHGNLSLLTGVLKGRMGFKGFVVGDWNGHGQVAGCTVTDCPNALMAGLDMFMAPDSWKGLFESLLSEAKSGKIPLSRIEDADRRILRVKAKLGLLQQPPEARFDLSQIGSPQHLALAREAVAKSLVLLKNNGSVLPIRPGAKVLVAGPGADNIAMQTGGWTISWQGTDVTAKDFTNAQTVYSALADAIGKAGGKAVLSADGAFSERPDVAIVVFGEKPYAEFVGDIPTLAYHPGDDSDLELIRKLKAAGIPVVSVFMSGRPMFVAREINASDAFVAAWLPGTQVNGIADVLVAKANGRSARDFTGRLSFPWPADARSPITKPLWPLGYGLDYESKAQVGPLSEDPMVDVAAAVDTDSLIANGKPTGAWTLNLVDSGGSRAISGDSGSSPNGSIAMAPVDLSRQESGRQFTWTGPASLLIDGPPGDFSREVNNGSALRFDIRPDAIAGPITVYFAGQPMDVTAALSALPKDKVTTVKFLLRCFAPEGGGAAVNKPLQIEAGAGTKLSIQTADVESIGEELSCPPAAH